MIEILGYAGAVAYLVAFALVTFGRWSSSSLRFQATNLVAGVVVGVNASYHSAWPSAILNYVWALFAAVGVYRALSSSDRSPRRVEKLRGAPFAGRRQRNLLVPLAFIAAAGLSLVLVPRPPTPVQPINIMTTLWPPYVTADADGGPLAAYVEDLASSTDFEAVLTFSTWQDAQQRAQDGRAVAAFPYIATPTREANYSISDPILTFEYTLFVRSAGAVGDDEIRSWSDGDLDRLPGRLGIVSGYERWDELASSSSVAEEYDTTEAAFIALAEGDVDLVLEGRVAGEAVLRSGTFPGDVTDVRPTSVTGGRMAGGTEELRVIATRNETGRAFIAQLNAAIESARSDGRADKIQIYFDDWIAESKLVKLTLVAPTLVTAGDGTQLLVPAGTTAYALQWPANAGGSDRSLPDGIVVVKLLDGPTQGQIVEVSIDAVEVTGG